MALFKIYKGLSSDFNNSNNSVNSLTHEGYCYFTTDDGKFYIDIVDKETPRTPDDTGSLKNVTRMPINSYLSDYAARAYCDIQGKEIDQAYGKKIDISGRKVNLLSGSDVTPTVVSEALIPLATLSGAITGAAVSNDSWEIKTTLSNNIVKTSNIVNKAVTNEKIANPSITINGRKINLGESANLSDLGLSTALRFIGITTTAIVDGSTQTSITLKNGSTVTASIGDVVINSLNNQEYVWLGSNWELLGDESAYDIKGTAENLIDNISLSKETDTVLGSSTTIAASSSAVSFGAHTTKEVLGAGATLAVTDPTIEITQNYTNIKASATGTSVSLNTGAALVGIEEGTTKTSRFVTSYPGAFSKMVTTTILGVKDSINLKQINKNVSDTATKISSFGEQAKLEATYDANTESLEIKWTTNVLAKGSDVTATNTTSESISVARAADATTTIATGKIASTGTGDSIMTGLGTAATSSAVTNIGTFTTENFATSVQSVSNPSITLETTSTAGTGVVSVVNGVGAKASGTTVTINNKDTVAAITVLGKGTAAAQKITVNANDQVKVLTENTTLIKP